jgi:hypothetical protein
MVNMTKYQLWQYRNDNNCWDFVRAVLKDEFKVPEMSIPRFGLCKDDVIAVDSAYSEVKSGFAAIARPMESAIACHFAGLALNHVGIVVGDRVWHVGSATNVRADKFRTFERKARTEYYKWQN